MTTREFSRIDAQDIPDATMWREIRRAVIMAVRALVKRYPNLTGLYILFGIDG